MHITCKKKQLTSRPPVIDQLAQHGKESKPVQRRENMFLRSVGAATWWRTEGGAVASRKTRQYEP